MATELTEAQWNEYEEQGYLRLGKLLSDSELAELQQRIDDIMLGKATLDYAKMMMQLDSDSGEYGDVGQQSYGHKGSTLNYRKIQDLEFDPIFLEYMQRPIFKDICERHYGEGCSASCFRAMFMNKPAGKGTKLPWHQDRWDYLDRDPLVTVWTALDPATEANGCVEIIPGSHKYGLINPSHSSGFLTPEQAEEFCPKENAIHLEMEPGEVTLLHNWLLHSSDKNRTDVSRRAFSVCYADGRTQTKKGATYPLIFGEGALDAKEVKQRAAAGA
jgi:hypothetical protein